MPKRNSTEAGDGLKDKLLRMASQAETVVNQAVKALLRRDDDLASRAQEGDKAIDRLEMEVDEAVLRLLTTNTARIDDLREFTTAMKVAHDLERVGDEATTIARRTLELSREPKLRQVDDIPPLASLVLLLLKEALDAFVDREPQRARELIPRDKEVDRLHKKLAGELAAFMGAHPETIGSCLNLLVVAKCLERVGDHAKNIAEMVVYACEGKDIRHRGPASCAS